MNTANQKTVNESSIVARIMSALRKRGAYVVKLHGGPTQQAGLPDLLVVHEGRVAFLEVKRPGGKPTPLQEHTMTQLRNHGATACVVWSVEDALGAMEI